MKPEYIGIIAIAIAAVCVLIFAWIKRAEINAWLSDPEHIELIKKLCREAEIVIIGSQQGLARLEWVAEHLRLYLPAALRRYVTAEMLKKVIHIIFEQIAVTMPDGSRRAI